MKQVLKSRGAKNVWNLLDESESFLEAITYSEEIEEQNTIKFFPNNTCEDSDLVKYIKRSEPNFPTDDISHYGGVKVGIVTAKGTGEVTVVHDMYDLFAYQYTQREVQIDYGRLHRCDMKEYISSIARILNTPKALKGRKLIKKDE
jgi:hypothetical protein|tara:strand:+ start:5416 stop:5853 length:438 start_codon:yes stop_codon:yes gene_type:complete